MGITIDRTKRLTEFIRAAKQAPDADKTTARPSIRTLTALAMDLAVDSALRAAALGLAKATLEGINNDELDPVLAADALLNELEKAEAKLAQIKYQFAALQAQIGLTDPQAEKQTRVIITALAEALSIAASEDITLQFFANLRLASIPVIGVELLERIENYLSLNQPATPYGLMTAIGEYLAESCEVTCVQKLKTVAVAAWTEASTLEIEDIE
ncbi:hypothetical protein HZB07_03140 [Candidatus Saganbacteria bacterium]|nr:hypothetical protein [Candidatus Saganbacteria bacterium]